jgi:hypothetical protein
MKPAAELAGYTSAGVCKKQFISPTSDTNQYQH